MQYSGREIEKWLQSPCGWIVGSGGGIGHKLRELQADIPDVRRELVNPLRLAIAENRYHVPEEQVAERMLYLYIAGLLS